MYNSIEKLPKAFGEKCWLTLPSSRNEFVQQSVGCKVTSNTIFLPLTCVFHLQEEKCQMVLAYHFASISYSPKYCFYWQKSYSWHLFCI